MKRICFICILMFAFHSSYAQKDDVLKVTSYTLENGLTVWLNEDHTAPTALGAVVIKAGARDCPGTGIAHYFEHMMFKGTDKIGTVNYTTEKPYLDSIAVMYDSLAVARDDAGRTEIQMEINRLNIEGARYVVPNEFDALSTLCGSSNLNAGTAQDYTMYYSDFIPQQFELWAQLNSERIINPVFRLFQSELETVYEEKNMYADDLFTSAFEKMEEYAFDGTPYAMPIIGTTSNLKNPQLSQMTEFFNTYYVAGNMGLLITGDFDSETVKPIIEKTFGRIRPGHIERKPVNQPDLKGRKEQDILINVPLVQVEAIFYKAPPLMQKDYHELKMLSYLLTNSEGVGLMDKLQNEHEVMYAGGEYLSYCDAGGFIVYFIPKLLGQSTANAERKVMNVIGRLKSGDFEDELLQSCKLSYIRQLSKQLESNESRADLMADSFLSGKSWEEYLRDFANIKSITKEDIVRVANRYLTDDCIVFHKKKGNPEKDKLQKPPYEHVTPESKDSTSLYAREFRRTSEEVQKRMPEFDFDANIEQTQLAPQVKLFSAGNPVNDIFHLKLKFQRGSISEPALDRLAAYMNKLGTVDKSYDELYRELQGLGGSMYFSSSDNNYTFTISGYDESFEKTFALASSLLKDIKGDRKKLKAVLEEEKAKVKMARKDISNLVHGLYGEVAYGERSPLLVDKGKADDDFLLGLWKEIQTVQCNILYSGNLKPAQVSETIRKYMDADAAITPTGEPQERIFQQYSNSEVKFINKPDASQTMVYAFIPFDILPDLESRTKMQFLDSYLGGGMTSVMFQEIREFRSMAYSTGSAVYIPEWKNREQQGGFMIAVVGTQCDKAVDAMSVIDSLLNDVPMRPQKFMEKKIEFFNELYHGYPGFRNKAAWVENYLLNGLDHDTRKEKMDIISSMTEENFTSFAKEHLSGKPIVWCVVGNSRKMDMKALETFGKIEMLKPSDVIR